MSKRHPTTQLQRALAARMQERGLSMRALSLAAGLGETFIKDIMQGKARSTRWDTLEKIAAALGYSGVSELLAGGGDGTAPLIGAAGAGDIVARFPEDASFEQIPAPMAGPRGACVVVRGESMLPVYRDGDLLFFLRPDSEHDGGVNPAALRRDCVIEAMDGTMYVKTVLPAGRKGLFNLASYNRPDVIADVRIRWAAPILWVKRG